MSILVDNCIWILAGSRAKERVEEESIASNNYALIISDPTKARWVLTDLNRMASRGGAFKVLKFNPASDRFPISCGRESNLPPLLYVEEDGATVDGATVQAQWSIGNTV